MPKLFEIETEIEQWLYENNIFYEEDEKKIMNAYSRIEGFNRRIRIGGTLLDDWKALEMKLLKKVNWYKLPETIITYRGISKDAYKQMCKDAETLRGKINLSSSKILLEKAYMSTSLIKGRELKSSILLKIIVPKGTKFLYIGGNSVSPEQTEMLFGKNTQMKEIRKNGNCIELEVVS